MAEFFAKVRPECERDGDVWVKFSELVSSPDQIHRSCKLATVHRSYYCTIVS